MRYFKYAVGLLGMILVMVLASASALEAVGTGVTLAMATSATTDSAMDAAMKVIFDDSLVNSVVTDSELVDIFPDGGGIQVDQTTGGRYIETAQMFGLPAGVGARSEGGYIPIPDGPDIVNGQVTLKKVMGSVEMTAEVLKRVKSDMGAFVNWGERAMPSLVERVTNELDRMLLGYGAGIKARVNDLSPATDLLVDDAFGVAGFSNALLQFLQGERLVAGPNADGTGLRGAPDEMRVTAVDHDNGYIVVDGLAAGLADDDYLFPGDAAGNSAGIEPMGLMGIVDDGGILNVFQNINRTTYPAWRSYVLDVDSTLGSGSTLTEDALVRADDESFTRGGAKIDTFVTSRLGLRQLWEDLRQDRQINDPRAYEGGKGPIRILLIDRMIEVRVARKMPDRLGFGITKKSLRKWLLNRWEWDDTPGSIWRQVTDSTGRKDAFYAYGSLYSEYGCRDPQKNFRVENWTG